MTREFALVRLFFLFNMSPKSTLQSKYMEKFSIYIYYLLHSYLNIIQIFHQSTEIQYVQVSLSTHIIISFLTLKGLYLTFYCLVNITLVFL